MSQQRIETIDAPQVTIACAGDLVVRSTVEMSVLVRGDDFTVAADAGDVDEVVSAEKELKLDEKDPTAIKIEEIKEPLKLVIADSVSIASNGDLVVHVPRDASVILLDTIGGDASIKNIGGTVTANEIGGDMALSTIGGSVTLHSVHGDLSVSGVDGDFSINTVNGDLAVNRVDGDTSIEKVNGDFAAKSLSGNVALEEVLGDAALRSVGGNLTIGNVFGDCSLANLGGNCTVHVTDDIRIKGDLAQGEHYFSADSTISFHWPAGKPIMLNATAPKIRNRITFDGDAVTETEGVFNAVIGKDGPLVNLDAGEKITMRETGGKTEDANGWGGFQFEFDTTGWADFGQMISQEVNEKMELFSAKINEQFGPDFAAQMERHAQRAADQAQRAAEKAMRKAEQAMRKAERNTQREAARAEQRNAYRSAPPSPPKAPSPPKSDTRAEQMKILKMLEEGKISLEDANKLLEALG
jgi:hypothetical protein